MISIKSDTHTNLTYIISLTSESNHKWQISYIIRVRLVNDIVKELQPVYLSVRLTSKKEAEQYAVNYIKQHQEKIESRLDTQSILSPEKATKSTSLDTKIVG